MCLTAIVPVTPTPVIRSPIECVTAAYLCARHVIIPHGRHHCAILIDPLLPALDFLLKFIQIIQKNLPCLLVERVVIACLFFNLQVIELEVETLLLVLLVLHGLDILNIVTNFSMVRTFILISHERKSLCEGTRILIIFKSKVFQRDDIVLYVIVSATCRATRIKLGNYESSRLCLFLIPITVFLRGIKSLNHLVWAVRTSIFFPLFW